MKTDLKSKPSGMHREEPATRAEGMPKVPRQGQRKTILKLTFGIFLSGHVGWGWKRVKFGVWTERENYSLTTYWSESTVSSK